jgi:hypothetical protein
VTSHRKPRPRPSWRAWIPAAIGYTAALTACVLAASTATTAHAAPGTKTVTTAKVKAVPLVPWTSCIPRRSLHDGIYRVDDDLFQGSKGTLCVRSQNGHDLRVLNNLPASPKGTVVAAPAIRIGSYYGAPDPGSTLPLPVGHIGALTLHVITPGADPSGTYFEDTELFFYNSQNTTAEHVGEIEIVTRTSPDENWQHEGGQLDTIEGRKWWVLPWWTSQNGQTWRLVRIMAARNMTSVALHVARFVAVARGWPGLPGAYLGNGDLQAELWAGGLGIRLGLTENGLGVRPGLVQ